MKETELNHLAKQYFQKSLILSEDTKSLEETGIDHEEEEVVDVESETIHEPSEISEDTANESINKAKEVLSNFPLDKSQYSPNREYVLDQSIFDEVIEPEKAINSLLFSTKLKFFNTSKNSTDIINEISRDSFGYINILRGNQIKIMESEIDRINDRIVDMSTGSLTRTINEIRSKKEAQKSTYEKHLDLAIEIYAKYNFPPEVSKDEAKKTVKDWLNDKNK